MRDMLDRRLLPLHLNITRASVMSDKPLHGRSEDGMLWTLQEHLRGGLWKSETGEYVPCAATRLNFLRDR